MTFSQPYETIRQTMHRIIDRLDIDENNANFSINRNDNSAQIVICNIDDEDEVDMGMTKLELCKTVVEGFDEVNMTSHKTNHNKYKVILEYSDIPSL